MTAQTYAALCMHFTNQHGNANWAPALAAHTSSASATAHLPPSQDCPEKAVFDGVMKWAGYGSEVESAASACHPRQDLEQLLPCIRFPLMKDAELELVRCSGAGVGNALVVGAGAVLVD